MSSRTGKIQSAWTATGSTLYAIIRNAVAEAWNVGGAVFEAFNVANWSQYAVAMTEQGALSQFYVADLPAGAEAYYAVAVYEQAGVGPAVGDTLVEVVRASQLADDVPHGGTPGGGTATLAAEQINVTNPAGIACTIFGDSEAINISANTSTAIDVSALGAGATAILVNGDGNSIGINANTGNGLDIQALGGGGVGVNIQGDLQGVNASGVGASGVGMFINGFVSAVQAIASADAVVKLGDGASGTYGLLIGGAGGFDAVRLLGDAGGAGLTIVGGASGDGLDISSGPGGGGGVFVNGTIQGIAIQSGSNEAVAISAGGPVGIGPAVGLSITTVAPADAVQVNALQSIDQFGRARILSSLTSGFDLLAFPFIMTDLAGNPKTGLTVTSTVSIDGAAAVPTANSATEVGNGQYSIDLAASDRAGTTMMLRFTAPNARDLDIALINTA